MAQLQGVGVGRGVAVGPVLRMSDRLPEPADIPSAADPEAERQRTLAALESVAAQLEARGAEAGGTAQEVLDAASMMALDPTVMADIARRIAEGKTGERAVFEAFAVFQTQLLALGGYLAERAADLADVSQRVIAELRGVTAPGIPESDAPFVLVARDLAPADTVLLDLDKVLGFVTQEGGPTSHTAILARARSIPAIVGVVGAGELTNGIEVIVDAAAGVVTSSPAAAEVAAARSRLAARATIAAAPIGNGALADGTAIALLANVGSASEAATAVALGAEGVGLLRTEFLFLDSATAPSVAVQQRSYTDVLAHFPGKKVVARVLDAGADKPLAFLSPTDEPNPALGLRGLRALRSSEHVLIDQLTALAAAQKESTADLWVMAPMVADAAEAEYFVELAKSLGLTTVGVMVEIPSVAIVADQVIAVADFVSVGTNDLTQYTLAADRMLGSVSSYQDAWHPAVLRLIKTLGDAGSASGTPVGICGEAAADPELAVVLVGLGATSLSMAPASLAEVRSELATVTLAQARAKAAAALAATTASSARAAAARA